MQYFNCAVLVKILKLKTRYWLRICHQKNSKTPYISKDQHAVCKLCLVTGPQNHV